MKRSSVHNVRSFFQNQVGRFLAIQLMHTVITAVILVGFFFGAMQVGALDSVLAPAAQTTDSSFTTINYQGRLADPGGTPISDTLTLQFALYDAPSDGSLLWGPEVHADVPVSEGLFSVRLGQRDALPTNIFNGGDVWLETTVKGETLSPREKLTAVPYAMVAGEVLTVSSLDAPDGDPQNALIVDEDGDVGIGTTNPRSDLQIGDPSVTRGGQLRLIGNRANTHEANNLVFGDDGNRNRYWMNTRGMKSDGRSWIMYYDNREPYSGIEGGELNGVIQITPESDGSNSYAMYFHSGDVWINSQGDFGVSGSKSAVVDTESYGERKLYAFEQPTNRFGDEGRAELVDGTARVELDPIFLETVEDDFLIHLTPYGDASLYVAEIGADYFVVQAREAADDVPFAWMLTATRSGYESVRLEEVGSQE